MKNDIQNETVLIDVKSTTIDYTEYANLIKEYKILKRDRRG